MAISDKTRKMLWGASGNRCAICKRVLVVEATDADDASIVAEECHIVSSARQGPRHDPNYPPDRSDECENLILLCRTHHKMVDDQVATYTVGILRQMKANHERWVTETLDEDDKPKPVRIRRHKANIPQQLNLISSGKDLFNLVQGASGYLFDHDEPQTEEEMETIGGFLQNLQDWGEVSEDFEAGDRVRASFALSQELSELMQSGFLVFGAEEIRTLEGGIKSEITPLSTAIIRVLRADNPDICNGSESEETENGGVT